MSLAWPLGLLALAAAPLLLAARWWLNRRRRRVAVRLPSVALIRAALPGTGRWRRRLPAALFVAGLLVLGVGVARPQASVAVPSSSTSILLAIDVSLSMCSTDVAPNRLSAASEAARRFVRSQDDGTRIGLVAFSGISGVLVEPTTDKEPLLAAIDSLKTARGTAIGLAIMTAIDAIAEINPDVPRTGVDAPAGPGPSPEGSDPPPGGPAGFEPDTIVVLTDGANTQGLDPVTAAEQARERRLRIYTIGFGSTEPSPLVCTPDQISGGDALRGDGWGRFGGGGGRRVLRLDEPTLTRVADLTGGEYYRAQDAEQLTDVLTDLPRQISLQREDVELTAWFVPPGALLVLAALGLSVWWNRVPAPARPRRDP
jgi:Ca-activated chloride channel family protein